jgi:RimJ/RimL family protein N-acetyltransferase/uncharacterized protein (DUF952 family)
MAGAIELRRTSSEDALALFPLVYQSPVTDTLHWDGPISFDEYQKRLEDWRESIELGQRHTFTILELPVQRPIGACSIRPNEEYFRADIGLWIGLPYQGRGYGTQAVRLLVDFGFRYLGLERIEASIFVGNLASLRIFEKNGFQLEGTLRRAIRKRGVLVDDWVVGILRDDWQASRQHPARDIDQYIIHICPRPAWLLATASGEYRAESLVTEGFIHTSRPEQVLEVANRFYSGMKDLLVLWIDPARLSADLRWEAVAGQVFPHLYGTLNLEAVTAVRAFLPDTRGEFQLLPGL